MNAATKSFGSRFLLAAGALFALALGLRLWGIIGSLPFPGNSDEVFNYVLPAVRIPKSGLEPIVMLNPTGYIYLCWLAFGLLHGFGSGITSAFEADPGALILDARLIAALAGSLTVPVIWAAARKAFDPTTALVAGLVGATAFLPVAYSHMSLNDAVAMLPVAVGLLGAIGILRDGTMLWYLVGGVGSGLAAGVKYTGGYVILAVLLAAVIRVKEDGAKFVALRALAALAGAFGGFFITNPFALIDPHRFRQGLDLQNTLSSKQLKYGETQHSALAYYGWTLTWGIGWLPAIAALAGAVIVAVRDRLMAVVLVLPALALGLFLATKPLYFGRYLLPIYPVLCLLAGVTAATIVTKVRARGGKGALAATVLLAALLCAQSLVHSVHFDLVWSRASTQTLAADWVKANVPAGTPMLTDQYLPAWWPDTHGSSSRPALPADTYPAGLTAGRATPSQIESARASGHCWVVVSSHQAARAAAEPLRVPGVTAYYERLHRTASLAFRATPFTSANPTVNDAGPLKFSYDWSWDAYPLAYERPGPVISIYRLANCVAKS